MKLRSLAILAALTFPGFAFAQTCAPTTVPTSPISSDSSLLGQTTCGGQAGLDLGGTIYSHPSKVYEFVAQGANATITFGANADREMSLVTGCTSAPLFIGFVGGPLVIPPGSLTDGTKYYLVVSTDPSIPTANPPVCGSFDLVVNGRLPVALQKFSVE